MGKFLCDMGDGNRRSNCKGSIQSAKKKIFCQKQRIATLWVGGSLPGKKGHSVAPTSHVVKIFPNEGRTSVLLWHCCHNNYRYDTTPDYKKEACFGVSTNFVTMFIPKDF